MGGFGALSGARVARLVLAALLPVLAWSPAGATPLNVQAQGANGVVRATEPGRTCAEDGEGSYRHFAGEVPIAAGTLSQLTGNARTTLDVHYDGPGALGRGGPNAFLLGSESHLTLSNQRGTVQVLLRGATASSPPSPSTATRRRSGQQRGARVTLPAPAPTGRSRAAAPTG